VIVTSLLFTSMSLFAHNAAAHCEVPCGIYDDQLRTKLIAEHISTIEKSIMEIRALEKAKPINYNQIVRWTTNKDDHANKLQHIVSQYFMTQRIVPDSPESTTKLLTLHKLLVYAMKAKQSTDLNNTKILREQLAAFEKAYFH
jgi:nickel superoxide dismutase